MTKVSYKYLFHNLGGFTADVMALCSNDSINKLPTMGAHRISHGCPLGLFIKLTLEQDAVT